jgi:ferritin-like metal-binding protein YciE
MEQIVMKMESLKELYVEELQDLYSAETQITKALPKMAKAATSPALRDAFESHLEETKEQIKRLDQIFENLGESSKGKPCEGMKGLLKEGGEWMKEDADPEVMDAGLIAAAQRVEHYEMAGYGTVRTYAELLGEDEAVALLETTLKEEKAADSKLSKVANKINVQANKAA